MNNKQNRHLSRVVLGLFSQILFEKDKISDHCNIYPAWASQEALFERNQEGKISHQTLCENYLFVIMC